MPRAEASARWVEGELQAGETAKLKVTVRNTGKGELYRFIAKTVSSNKAFNDRKLEFGKIEPEKSRTLELSFEIDELMRTQDIPISIRFEEYNDYVPPDIDAKLHVVEKPRPKFDYAYRILDGGTPNSVGNGDGIIQRGESVDIVLTVRNSGAGPAEDVTTMLNLSGESGVEMFSASSIKMENIMVDGSRTATFNVGVKPNTSVRSLSLKLSVTENRFGDAQLTDTINLPIDQKVAPKIVVVHLDGMITADSADVRSGADSKMPVIAQIPQNSRVRITGQLEDWYRVELKELTGWINAYQITTEKVPAPTASPQIFEPTVIKVFQRMPPQLTLVSPERNQIAVNTETITLTAVATDDKGIEKIELTVNGKPFEGRGFRPRETVVSRASITIKEAIPLSYGENQIKLVAFDTDNQHSEPIVVNVTRTREMGELWVLSIGISDYQHVCKLNYADDDAKAVADYFHNIGVPSDHITLLLDGKATVSAIRQAFGELIDKVIFPDVGLSPTITTNETKDELVDDFVAVITSMSARIYGRRNAKKKLRKSNNAYCHLRLKTRLLRS
jgi:carboxyl-terminal processing protease